jgi:alkylhydroperoxidase family enzyme
LLTKVYDTDYRNWITDITGTVTKPTKPSTNELRDAYGDLENYKSVSDAIVFNSVKYRPLFGDKADTELQATFKVVKNTATLISDNEIKARIIEQVNKYFAVTNWDFGDTFYFSELAAYLHNSLTPDVLSVIVVPKSSTSGFGSLYQIASSRDEIFISAATVNDVEIIDVITAAQIQASGNVVNTTSDITTTESVSGTGSATVIETTTNNSTSTTTAITGGSNY